MKKLAVLGLALTMFCYVGFASTGDVQFGNVDTSVSAVSTGGSGSITVGYYGSGSVGFTVGHEYGGTGFESSGGLIGGSYSLDRTGTEYDQWLYGYTYGGDTEYVTQSGDNMIITEVGSSGNAYFEGFTEITDGKVKETYSGIDVYYGDYDMLKISQTEDAIAVLAAEGEGFASLDSSGVAKDSKAKIIYDFLSYYPPSEGGMELYAEGPTKAKIEAFASTEGYAYPWGSEFHIFVDEGVTTSDSNPYAVVLVDYVKHVRVTGKVVGK